MSKIMSVDELADGSITWTSHKGFNSKIIDKEYDVEKIGAKDAVDKGLSSTDAKFDEFTPNELDIILKPVGEYFSSLKNDVDNIVSTVLKHAETLKFGIKVNYDGEVVKTENTQSSKELETVIETIEQDWLSKLDSSKREFSDDLSRAANKEKNKAMHLRFFRKENNLNHRDASYPDSHIMHIALILLALVGEAIGNAYFYSQGSDLGLLGGWLSALLISAANVAISFMIGFVFLRYLTHVKLIPKIFGFVGLLIGLSALGLLHLGAAHYRELLAIDPESAHSKVLSSVLNSPFNLNELDTLVMILLGVVVSMLVMGKGYTYDDSYPGYGKIWRAWLSENDNWNGIDNIFRNDVAKIMDNAKRQVSQIESAIEKTNSEFVRLKQDFKPYLEGVSTNTKDAVSSAVNFCSLYRKGYNEIAGEEVLQIQDDKLTKYILDRYKPYDFDAMLKDKKDNLDKFALDFKKWSEKKLKELKQSHQKLIREFNDLTSEEKENEFREIAKNNAKKTIDDITSPDIQIAK